MKTRLALLFQIAVLISFPIASQSAFIDTGWGARPAGMGNAFTAVADDANAAFWNPAGLGRIQITEIMFMYAMPYMGMENVDLGFSAVSMVVPIKENVFGISWTNFTSAGQYSENAFNLTYSRFISERFFIGGNIKYLGHNYEIEAGFDDPVFDSAEGNYGLDADAGFLFCLPNKLCIGLALRNILETDLGLYDADTLKKEVRGGIAFYPNEDITIAVDVDYKGSSAEFFGGGEYWLMNRKFALRAGTNYRNKTVNEITTGASYRQSLGDKMSINIDYCFSIPLTMVSGYSSHRIAMTIGF